MGSFFGHALPGTFFLCFALWWMLQAFRRYFMSMSKHGAPFRSTPHFTVIIRGKRRNVEAIIVIIMTSLGIFVELVAASIKEGHFVGSTNYQHSTMYFFFGLVGVLSLVLPKFRFFPNHQDIVYVFLVMAFAVEALLFKFHLYGRENLDVLIHTLLLYTVYGCIIATIVEMRNRESFLAVQARAFFTILQGTWFWQAGFILYNPLNNAWGQGSSHNHDGAESTDDSHADHEYKMLVTCGFIWHMAAILLLMLAAGSFIGCFYRKRGLIDSNKAFELEGRKNAGAQGYTVLELSEENEAS